MVKRFEWDERKSDETKAARGVSFNHATQLFGPGGHLVTWRDQRHTKEYRYAGMGVIDGRVYHVVFMIRNGHFRIIQYRKANKREQNEYNEDNEDNGSKPSSKRRSKKFGRSLYRKDV